MNTFSERQDKEIIKAFVIFLKRNDAYAEYRYVYLNVYLKHKQNLEYLCERMRIGNQVNPFIPPLSTMFSLRTRGRYINLIYSVMLSRFSPIKEENRKFWIRLDKKWIAEFNTLFM